MKRQSITQVLRRTLGLSVMALALSSAADAASLKLIFTGGVNPGTATACTSASTACLYRNAVYDDAAGASLPASNPYQRDVIVRRTALVNATLNEFDQEASLPTGGSSQYFEPVVSRYNYNRSAGQGYATFSFTFYPTGQTNPTTAKALDGSVYISSLDVDSSGGGDLKLNEFVTVYSPDAAGISTPSNLSLVQTPIPNTTGAVTYINVSDTNGTDIDKSAPFKFSSLESSPSIIIYTAGSVFTGSNNAPVCNANNTTCNRLSAISFDRFDALPLAAIVDGYKSVKLTSDADNSGTVTAGDTLTWEITYVNTGNSAVNNFQITDGLPGNVTFTPSGNQVVTPGTGSTATKNAAYAGTGNLLAGGATLAANSTIKVSIPVVVGVGAAGTTLSNQASAGGTAVNGPNPSDIKSDNVDDSVAPATATVFPPSVKGAGGFGTVPSGSLLQSKNDTVDATTVTVATVAPKLTLNKAIAAPGRLNAADQFTIQIKDGTTLKASADTMTTGTTAATGTQTLAIGTTYTLTEIMKAGSSSALTAYTTAIICTNTATGSSTTLPTGAGQSFNITPKSGDIITCTLTNTAKLPDLTITKSHTGNFARGTIGTYNFVVSNLGNAVTSGTMTLTDTLPAGLRVNGGAAGSVTLGGADASRWTCNSALAANGATQAVTCTSTTALAAGGTNALTLAVQVTAAADTGTLINTVQIAGGGETNTANNTASDNTTVVAGAATVFTTSVCSSNASLRTLVDWSNTTVSAAYGKGPFSFTTASSGVSTTVTSDVASIRRTTLSGQPSPFGGSYLELDDVNSTVTITLSQAVRVQTILADFDNTESATIVGYNGTILVLPTITPNTSFSPSVSNLGTSIGVSAAGLGSVNVPDLETTGTVNIIFNSPVDKIVITNTAAVGTLDLLNFLACAPTLNVKKTTVGGTGSFDFTADNGYGTATLATTAANTPVASGARTLTAASAMTKITETLKSNWNLTGAACVDRDNSSVPSTLAGNVLTLAAANVKIDNDYSCTFTNTTATPVITLLKLGRNITVSPSQPFIGSTGSIGVKPGETVEYCIVYSNTGGAANNFVLTDYVPVGMVAQPSAYGTNVGGDALGLKYAAGVVLAVGDADSSAVTPKLTSKSGDDTGTLSNAPTTKPNETTPTYPGVMTLNLGAAGVAAGTTTAPTVGTVCFQAKVP